MNFLILGDGPDELAWAHFLADHPSHRLAAAWPGFKSIPDLPGGVDLDEALALAGLEAAIVGGEPDLRAEALRRVASAGWPIICLHPPGPNADPYYQIALSRQETGAIVVPDLSARLHPGICSLDKALHDSGIGSSRWVQYEINAGLVAGPLTKLVLPHAVDVVRWLIGDIEAVTATGDPPGEAPTARLVAQLRGPEGVRAEIRLTSGPPVPARLAVFGSDGSVTLEHDTAFLGPSRLIRRTSHDAEIITTLDPWDPKAAILGVLERATAGDEVHPNLLDGTRAMEIAEATRRSLRRGRTVDLHYEEITEVGNFKSVMTAVGCGLLLAALVMVPIALTGAAFGITWMIYLAWMIPPLLVAFVLFQFIRFAIPKTDTGTPTSSPTRPADENSDE